MGVCASCLGGSRHESPEPESSRLLDDDPYQAGYGYGALNQAQQANQPDPEYVRREREALDAICQRTSDSVIDIWSLQPQPHLQPQATLHTSASASPSPNPDESHLTVTSDHGSHTSRPTSGGTVPSSPFFNFLSVFQLLSVIPFLTRTASMAGPTVYSLPTAPPNWDRVGIFYLSFAVIWSTFLIAGMLFCWFNRQTPLIRVRGIPLSFTAIALLHAYWVLGQITYPIRVTIPTILACDIQYFAMGIYFPFGIALFQASNLRFLHISTMQKQFANTNFPISKKCNSKENSILYRLRSMDYVNRTLILIGTGMALQFIITVGMWFACAKYHPSYGIPGTEVHGATLTEQLAYMNRGWEWWPSLLWQMIWTWIVAPVLIFRAWGIHDTMGWRTQTIACCLASLHATPMFLIASYLPAFEHINVYFAPSQWIHVSIFIWEIFTVFVPVFQILRLWAMNKRTTHSIAKYEISSFSAISKSPPPSPSSPSLEWKSSSSSTLAEKTLSPQSFEQCHIDRLYTMEALEHVLEKGSEQLQEFAALSDFSGENISFLGQVGRWKQSWPVELDPSQVPDAFNQALGIYATFISVQDADFPLNISSQSLKNLQMVFEGPTRILFGDKSVNSTSPFVSEDVTPPLAHVGIQNSCVPAFTGEIPEGFDMSIFDNVQEHIKWLVLTNTWPKFIDTMRRRSIDTERSYVSSSSRTSLPSRLRALIKFSS